ncbi:unnamed protein product [Leptosia nina]|uniref:Uncharacterized protein n=1 Tax=Leptosia nina TaxID=320188 RepID=A0AAV1J5R1_9NEOP
MLIKYFAFLWVCGNVFCQLSPENVTEVLLKYEGYIKSAQDLDKGDKQLLKTWASLEQVQLVNLTSHYRLEMSRHKENSFGRVSTNPSWHECLTLHEKEIKKLERKYYSCEADCLTVASGANHAEKQAVHQIGKEIRKWRKSYRYLANQCHDDNPRSDDAAGLCLVEYGGRSAACYIAPIEGTQGEEKAARDWCKAQNGF